MAKSRRHTLEVLNDYGHGFNMSVQSGTDTADVDIIYVFDGEETDQYVGVVADAYDLLEMIELLTKVRNEILDKLDEQDELPFDMEFDLEEDD